MASPNRFLGILMALLVAVSVAPGCTDDTASTNNGNNGRTDPETEVPEGSRLEHVDPCNPAQPVCSDLDVTFNSSRSLKVKLLDGDDNPIPDTLVNFELNAGMAEGTTLSSASAATDASGLAEVEIRAGGTDGIAEVIASAGSEEGVEPIKFEIAINSKGAAAYKVSFNHQGASKMRRIVVRAFTGDTTCDEVREDLARERDPQLNPTLTSERQQSGNANVDGTLPVVQFPSVANGTSYTFEARGYSRDNDDVEVAFGCKDGNPPVENGVSEEVTVDLTDNLPRIAGEYEVTHTFSLRDVICEPDMSGGYDGVLPSGVCLAIDLIGRLATDPASFFLGTPGGQDGILTLIVDFLPDSVAQPIEDLLGNNFVNSVARDALNQLLMEWINNNAPSWLGTTVDVTADIYNTLEEFQVNGIVRIKWEPEASFDQNSGAVVGLLKPQTDMDGNEEMPGRQVWNEISVFWTGDCDPGDDVCRKRTFSAADVGTNDVVAGDFTGSLIPVDNEDTSFGLVVDEHTLTLNYGLFALGVIENVIFPSIFGQSVTSVEDAIDFLLNAAIGGNNCSASTGCGCFGEFVGNQIGGNNVANIAESACSSLIQEAGSGLRGYLTENLTVEGEDTFLIATPAEQSCLVYQPDAYSGDWNGKPLPYIEKLGTPEMECNWDVDIKYGSGANDVIDTDGTFHGTRTSF